MSHNLGPILKKLCFESVPNFRGLILKQLVSHRSDSEIFIRIRLELRNYVDSVKYSNSLLFSIRRNFLAIFLEIVMYILF